MSQPVPGIRCPACGAVVPFGTAVCPSCRAAIPQPAADRTVALSSGGTLPPAPPAPAPAPATAGGPPAPRPTATSEQARVFAGRYEVLAKLGQGAFGIVYRARDKVLDREVALKILKLEAVTDATQAGEHRARFQREAQTVAKLHHPNIIPVFDLGEAQGYSYIAMQVVTGKPLDAFLREKSVMPAESVARLGAALADALGYAHAHGVIHRDIKPANVILDEGNVPRIADFGIAKVQHDPQRTRENVIVGTLSYMSPEQIRGEELDGRSDLFSLGCVLYELLTGHRPFDGPNMTAIVSKIVHEPFDFSALDQGGIPKGIVDVLRRALEKDRNRRFRDGAEMRDALEKLLPERQADTAELHRLSAEVARLQREKKRANLAMAVVGAGGAATFLGVQALRSENLAAFLPVFAIVSPAVLLGVFYRDVLRKLSPVWWMLSSLFAVLVLADSYYFWKLATTATELAAGFHQKIPEVTYLHASLAGAIVNNLFLVALLVNLAIVALRGRREAMVAAMNRPLLAGAATLLVAGFTAFMFTAMLGHWNAMSNAIRIKLTDSKLRQLEEEGKYDAVIEQWIGKVPEKTLADPIWQRRLARMYRASGKPEKAREAWAKLGEKLTGKWDPADPAIWLAVARDFARVPLYREDAVAVLRAGLEKLPGNAGLLKELHVVLAGLGHAAEVAAVDAILNPPPPPETAASSAAPPPAPRAR